jgi:outer membrane protein assembly factor BamB
MQKKEHVEFKQKPLLALIAKSVAAVSALFAIVLSVLLIADHMQLLKMDPLNDPMLLELREQLANSNTDNEQVVEQIRTFDLYARRAFFSNQEQRRTGGLLILLGAVACFVALKLSTLWNPVMPRLEKKDEIDRWEMNNLFRQLMAGTGIFLVVISLFLAFAVQSDLDVVLAERAGPAERGGTDGALGPQGAGGTETVSPASSRLPEMRANWPSLRGAGNIGVAFDAQDAPIHWDVESGEGILWSAEIPVHGFNSPVVWGDRLFMAGGDEEGFEVFCYDANSGEELWTAVVEPENELPEVSEDTGFSAPTMASDGKLVFAIFASGDLAALDFEGKQAWQVNLGLPDNPYGMGSSLACDGQRIYVQYDHSDSQKVIALNCSNGEQVWETARHHISWSTPSIIETEWGTQLILNDEELVTAYEPSTGKELWSVKCLGGEVAPSPSFNGKDILFVGNEYAQASALKLNGATPEIMWQYDDYLPEIASPLAAEERFFIPTTAGDMICLDAQTGEVKWEQEFDDGFNSSPILVGDKVYAIDLSGYVYIFDAKADTYHEFATIEMGEPVHATPAFVGNRIYIRGDETLYCIGK